MTTLPSVKYIEYSEEVANKGIWGKIKRVALNSKGEIVGVHNKENTDLWEDGSEVDWGKYESDGWNCMVQIPKFYYYSTEGNTPEAEKVRRWEITPTEKQDFKIHDAFNRPEGKCEFQYIGAYLGWLDSLGKLRSLPNKKMSDNKTITEFRNHAKNNGEHWGIEDYAIYNAVSWLYMTEFGEIFPYAIQPVGHSNTNTGRSNELGNKSSYKELGKLYQSYRGIEDLTIGNIRFLDGMNINNLEVFISTSYTQYNSQSHQPNDTYKKIEGVKLPTWDGQTGVRDIFLLNTPWFLPSNIYNLSSDITAFGGLFNRSNSGSYITQTALIHENNGLLSLRVVRDKNYKNTSEGARLAYFRGEN